MEKQYRIAIIGAGDMGRQIAHHASQNGLLVIGFFDDFVKGAKIDGIPVLGCLEDVLTSFQEGSFDALFIGIGYKHFQERQRLFDFYQSKSIPFATLIDQSCVVDHTATVAAGCVLLPGCILDKGVKVQENVFMNVGVVLAHDTEIGAHTFIGPGVVAAGCVKIGRRCMLGVHSTYKDNISIGDDVVVGAAACAVHSIYEKGVYVGVPMKKLK